MHLFVCRRWYISIIPHGCNPGTTEDVDFYAAAPNFDDGFDDSLPPMDNWISCVKDAGSPPTSVYPYAYEDSDGGHSLSSNSLSVPSLAEHEDVEKKKQDNRQAVAGSNGDVAVPSSPSSLDRNTTNVNNNNEQIKIIIKHEDGEFAIYNYLFNG